MDKPINILDKDYLQWVKELCKRYRQSQVKAAVKVNHIVLQFYWELGKDICNKEAENRYGSKFYAALSRDLRNEMPDAEGLSERNLRYTKKFYQLYSQEIRILQQLAANSGSEILQQPAAKFNTEFTQQVANQLKRDIFSIPWGHHMLLIDKFLTEPQKALFYVQQVIENGWSRNVLHNYIDSSLYERQGKALSNFTRTLPDVGSDLAQEITRDPYNFAFTGITKPYNERILKDALLNNLQFELVMLYSSGSQDRIIHFCRCRATWWLCSCLQPSSSQRGERQPYNRFTYLQGERPHSGTVCPGIKQPTHSYF